jgi:hypothetical protein
MKPFRFRLTDRRASNRPLQRWLSKTDGKGVRFDAHFPETESQSFLDSARNLIRRDSVNEKIVEPVGNRW